LQASIAHFGTEVVLTVSLKEGLVMEEVLVKLVGAAEMPPTERETSKADRNADGILS